MLRTRRVPWRLYSCVSIERGVKKGFQKKGEDEPGSTTFKDSKKRFSVARSRFLRGIVDD